MTNPTPLPSSLAAYMVHGVAPVARQAGAVAEDASDALENGDLDAVDENDDEILHPRFVSAYEQRVIESDESYWEDPDEPGLNVLYEQLDLLHAEAAKRNSQHETVPVSTTAPTEPGEQDKEDTASSSSREGEDPLAGPGVPRPQLSAEELSARKRERQYRYFTDPSRMADRVIEKLIAAQEEDDITRASIHRHKLGNLLPPRCTLESVGLEDYVSLETWADHMSTVKEILLSETHMDVEHEIGQEEARLFLHRILENMRYYFHSIKQPYLPPTRLYAIDRESAKEHDWLDYLYNLMQAMDMFADLCMLVQEPTFTTRSDLRHFFDTCKDIATTVLWSMVCSIYLEWIEKRRDDVVGDQYDGNWNTDMRILVLSLVAKCTHDWNGIFVTLDPPETHDELTRSVLDDLQRLNLRQWGKAYDTHDALWTLRCDRWLLLCCHGTPFVPPASVLRSLKRSAWFRRRAAALEENFRIYNNLRERPDASSSLHADKTAPLEPKERIWNARIVDAVDLNKPFQDYTLHDAWHLMKWLHAHAFCLPTFSLLQILHMQVLWPVMCRAIVDADGMIRDFTGGIDEAVFTEMSRYLVEEEVIVETQAFDPSVEKDISKRRGASAVAEDVMDVDEPLPTAQTGRPATLWILAPAVIADIEHIMHSFMHTTTLAIHLSYLAGQTWHSDADPIPTSVLNAVNTKGPVSATLEFDNPFRPSERELLFFVTQVVKFLKKHGQESKNRNLLAEQLKCMSPGYMILPGVLALQVQSVAHLPAVKTSYMDLLETTRPVDRNGIVACIYESTAPIHMIISGMGIHAKRVLSSMASSIAEDMISATYASEMFADPSITRHPLDSVEDGTRQASFIMENMAPIALVTPPVRKEVHDRLSLLWFMQTVETWSKSKAFVTAESRLTKMSRRRNSDNGRLMHQQSFGAIARDNRYQNTMVTEITQYAIKELRKSRGVDIHTLLKGKVKEKMVQFASEKTGITRASQQDESLSSTTDHGSVLDHIRIVNYAIRALGSLADFRQKDMRKQVKNGIVPESFNSIFYGNNDDDEPRWAPLLKVDRFTGALTYLMETDETSVQLPKIFGVGPEYWVCCSPGRIFVRTRQWILALKVYTLLCSNIFTKEELELQFSAGKSCIDPVSASVFLGLPINMCD